MAAAHSIVATKPAAPAANNEGEKGGKKKNRKKKKKGRQAGAATSEGTPLPTAPTVPARQYAEVLQATVPAKGGVGAISEKRGRTTERGAGKATAGRNVQPHAAAARDAVPLKSSEPPLPRLLVPKLLGWR